MKHVGWRVGEEGTRCHLIAGVNPVDMASGKWMRVERHEGPCSDSKHRDIVQWIVVVLEVRGGLGQDGGCGQGGQRLCVQPRGHFGKG